MSFMESTKLMEAVSAGLDMDKMYADALLFSKLHRYSGLPDGEKSVDIIMERLAEYGVSAKREVYDIYRSLPVSSSLTVKSGDFSKTYNATPFVYSDCCENLNAKIVYDSCFVKGVKTHQLEQAKRCEGFEGNIVFTYDASPDFAHMAKKHGAVAMVTAWGIDIVHHGTTGRVWGTPEPYDLEFKYAEMPYTELRKNDGDELLELIKKGGVTGSLTIKMDSGVKKSSMAIADIKGKSDKYVLISGHYDGWYEGMTDNGIANVAMIDMARVFKEHEGSMLRGVKLAWWSGHSDGRYAGSTWYYDNYFEDLRDNCVAHINMDICGCVGSNMVGFNSSTLEGAEFCREFLLDYNESEPAPANKMSRFADQTFWGVNVPFAIMPRFTVKDAVRPFYWWHTPDDGIDKVDKNVMMRDAKVIATLGAYFAQIKTLPAHFGEFIALMERTLKDIESKLAPGFDISRIYRKLEALKPLTASLTEKLPEMSCSDDVIMKAAGELTRIVFTYSSPYHQDEAVDKGMFPVLSQAMGVNCENTDPVYLLAVKTAFVRQVNRVCGQIDYVISVIENELFKIGKK